MDPEQKLIDLVREATGDPDVRVAGDFQPKGLTWKVAAGAPAGSILGDAVGGEVAQADGTIVGAAGGYYAGSPGELPPVIVLAASPQKLYLMTTSGATGISLAEHLVLLDRLDRDNLAVEMHQRATVRTAVITDESTGHEYKIEGRRILFHHMNDMLDTLASHDESDAEHTSVVVPD